MKRGYVLQLPTSWDHLPVNWLWQVRSQPPSRAQPPTERRETGGGWPCLPSPSLDSHSLPLCSSEVQDMLLRYWTRRLTITQATRLHQLFPLYLMSTISHYPWVVWLQLLSCGQVILLWKEIFNLSGITCLNKGFKKWTSVRMFNRKDNTCVKASELSGISIRDWLCLGQSPFNYKPCWVKDSNLWFLFAE